VGLVGLLGYVVARRTNEIGIRMALGASGGQVQRMVLVESVSLVGAGVLVGVPAAWAVARYLRSQLVGLEPTDPSTAVLALLALVIIAGVAALVPARRAARVNPLTALREEQARLNPRPPRSLYTAGIIRPIALTPNAR
jgi:ABC-type antimicrobial peptide transport system permease subunit